jgi:hypothetical protein
MLKLPPLLLAVALLVSSLGCCFPWRQPPAPAQPAQPAIPAPAAQAAPAEPVQVAAEKAPPAQQSPPVVQSPAPAPTRAKFKKAEAAQIFSFSWRVGSRGKLYDNAKEPYGLRVVSIIGPAEMLVRAQGGGTAFILHGFASKDRFDGEVFALPHDMMEVTKTKRLGGGTYLVLESIGDLE